MAGNTSRKLNYFSVYKFPEHNTFISDDDVDENFGDDIFFTVGYDDDVGNTKSRGLLRAQILQGFGDETKIPYFDNIVGFRVHTYVGAAGYKGTPDVHAYFLNNDLTKYFVNGDGNSGSSWRYYKDASGGAGEGAFWDDDGADYDSNEDLAACATQTASRWYAFKCDNAMMGKSANNGDWISIILKENEGQFGDVVTFQSIRSTTTADRGTTFSPWREENRSGTLTSRGYIDGKYASQLVWPLVEIIYADETPEQPQDLKISGNDDADASITFSECSSEDVTGYMLFCCTTIEHYFDDLLALTYNTQTSNYTVTDVLTGGTSGATGYIVSDTDLGTWGTLALSNVKGTFITGETITDAHTGSAKASGNTRGIPAGLIVEQYGYVESYAPGAANSATITCYTGGSRWYPDTFNGYLLIFTSGKNVGKVYTIYDTALYTLTLSEAVVLGEFNYNDQFILVKPTVATVSTTRHAWVVNTNRGYFIPRAPDDDYPVYIKNFDSATSNYIYTPNVKYYFFLQALDNLARGPLNDRSNIVEIVRPYISSTAYFKIRAVSDNAQTTNIDVWEECYADIYATGGLNTVSSLKGIEGMEIYTGEYVLKYPTYTTTLTANWTTGTTLTLDLVDVPKTYFKVGRKVVITDGTNACCRTITAVGNNTITVDSTVPAATTFTANTTVVYPTRTFYYTSAGSKSGKVKARVFSPDNIPSTWQTPANSPSPTSIPGIAAMAVGPTEAEKSVDEVVFNFSGARVKPGNYSISGYYYDLDGTGVTSTTNTVVKNTYGTAGTYYPFTFIIDDDSIMSPGFGNVQMYDDGIGYYDETRDAWTYTDATLIDRSFDSSDYLYMGYLRPFDGIFFDIKTAFPDSPTWTVEYYNGSWTTLTHTDTTSELSNDGIFRWARPTDWVASSVNSSDTLYFVRIKSDGVTVGGQIRACIPLEAGQNYMPGLVVSELTAIDLCAATVIKDNFEFTDVGQYRLSYENDGILGTLTRLGARRIPRVRGSGSAFRASSLLISAITAGVPVFAGGANTDNLPDDVQVLQYIFDNNLLIKFTDRWSNIRYGYIKSLDYPQEKFGMPVHNWTIEIAVDLNRS